MYVQPSQLPRRKPANKRLNISKLKGHNGKQNLSQDLGSKLSQLDTGTKGVEDWLVFRDGLYNTAFTHLGQSTRRHQKRFDSNDDEIQKLLDEKYEACRFSQQDNMSTSKKAAYNTPNTNKVNKAGDIRKYADSNNFKRFYDVLKAIYESQSSGISPLLNTDGTTLPTDKIEFCKSGQKTSTTS
uniref:Uncharacterized protein n=1 Tax=Octopus bimaculoides TaxID=37653 RepID=A0A0L8H5Y2_OCTBM